MDSKQFIVISVAIVAVVVFAGVNYLLRRIGVPWPVRALVFVATAVVLIPFCVEPGMPRTSDAIEFGIGIGALTLGCFVARWNVSSARRNK